MRLASPGWGRFSERRSPKLKINKYFVKALGPAYKKTVQLSKLPPSDGFLDIFQDFTKEIAADEGSRLKSNTKDNGPFEMGQLPKPKKAQTKFYEIARQPWHTEPPLYNMGLYNSGLYVDSQILKFEVRLNRVLAWETYSRESLSMCSYMDHFMAVGQAL